MPKDIVMPPSEKGYGNHSGISVTWTPSARRLDFFGWFDTYVGIEGESMPLAEFFHRLGITEKDCVRAFKELAKHRIVIGGGE